MEFPATFADTLESGCGVAMRLWVWLRRYNSCGSSDSSEGRKTLFLMGGLGVGGR